MASAAHLVCFRIGKETFGVDIFAVREIVKPQEITAVPGTASFVLGIINLRGRIVSVVDLAGRLGLGTAEIDRSTRILVVDLDDCTVGFLVDEATEVMKLSGESIEPAPEELKTHIHDDYLEGVGKLGDRLVIILNPRHLLSEREVEVIDSVTTAKTPAAGASEAR